MAKAPKSGIALLDTVLADIVISRETKSLAAIEKARIKQNLQELEAKEAEADNLNFKPRFQLPPAGWYK